MPVTALLVLCAIMIVTAKANGAKRSGLFLEARAGHEKRYGNYAANERIGKITQQAVPYFRKLPADETHLRQNAHGKGHKAHDQDDFDTCKLHCSHPQIKIAVPIAVTSHPQRGLTSAPGIAAIRLTAHISAIVRVFISTTNSPAK